MNIHNPVLPGLNPKGDEKMKRKISICLTALLTAGLMAGCTGNGGQVAPEPTDVKDETPEVVEESEDTEEPEEVLPEDDESSHANISRFFDYAQWDGDEAADWLALYDEFFTSDGTVTVGTETPFLEEGYYTLTEMVEGIQASLEGTMTPSELLEIDYALIDAGKDGYPELVIKLPFSDPDGTREAPTEYVIIRPYYGELSVITIEETFYRTETFINEYGYIVRSGSNGASSTSANYYYITSDGEYYELYSSSTYFGLDEPVFCAEALSDSLKEALVDGEPENISGNYTLTSVLFDFDNAYDPENEYEQYMTERCKHSVYAFIDSEGEDAVLDEAYAQLCKDNGIEILPMSEIETMIHDYCSQFGTTDDIIGGEEPDFSLLTAS